MAGFALALVKNWKLAIGILCVVAIFAVVAAYNNAIREAERLREEVNEHKTSSQTWQAAYERSEALREREQRQAVSSFERERQQCNQRVADNLQSAQRIRSVVRAEEVEVPGICDAGSVITTDELRHALGTQQSSAGG